jgi:hypothetical protein
VPPEEEPRAQAGDRILSDGLLSDGWTKLKKIVPDRPRHNGTKGPIATAIPGIHGKSSAQARG